MEIYHFELVNPETSTWLATVFITDDGTFSAVTDYEPLGYRWYSIGYDNALDFILNTDDEYLTRKTLDYNKHYTYSHIDTINGFKVKLLKSRRVQEISAYDARIEWNLLMQFAYNELTFEQYIAESNICDDLYEFSDMYKTKPSISYEVTKNLIFPTLKNEIKKLKRIDKNFLHG